MKLKLILWFFRRSQWALRKYRGLYFPPSIYVHVRYVRYVGYGLTTKEDGCPDDKVPVRLQNGNVWWYPIESVRQITDMERPIAAQALSTSTDPFMQSLIESMSSKPSQILLNPKTRDVTA